MKDKEKKKYLISTICDKSFNCNFARSFSMRYLSYFPTKSKSWDIKYRLKALGKIEKNNFTGVIKNLVDYYKDVEYFRCLSVYVNDINNLVKDGVVNFKNLDYDIGFILANYLEYWENLNVVIEYGTRGNKGKKIVMENGELLLEQHLLLNRKEVMNMIFWSNMEKVRYKTYSEILEAVADLGLMDDDVKIGVTVYYFDRKIGKTREDMDFMIKRLQLDVKNGGEKNVYGIFNYDGAISFGQMMLNPSNFVYFNEVCLERFLEKEGDGGKLLFLAMRNYLLEFISPMDMKRFLMFSSIILYFYGMRAPSDIDMTAYWLPEAKGKLEDLFKQYGTTGKDILGVGELSVKGYGEWKKGGKKEHLEEWFLYGWPQMFGAKDYGDMVFNPRYYLNIMGMKVITLEADMERRKIRYRPASYADLIAYNHFMPLKIKLEEPPLKYYSGGVEESYDTPEKLQKLLKTIKNYLKVRFGINMGVKEIADEINLSSERVGFKVEHKEKEIDERMRKRLAVYDRLKSKVKE